MVYWNILGFLETSEGVLPNEGANSEGSRLGVGEGEGLATLVLSLSLSFSLSLSLDSDQTIELFWMKLSWNYRKVI